VLYYESAKERVFFSPQTAHRPLWKDKSFAKRRPLSARRDGTSSKETTVDEPRCAEFILLALVDISGSWPNRQLSGQTMQADRVFLNPAKPYAPETNDHKRCWPKMVAAIEKSGDRGATYAMLKAIGESNKDYAVYLIGQLGVLRCPALEQRLGISE
jgi:hypothetical protein